MVYNVGQARTLYGIPKVVIPEYINKSLSSDQYPYKRQYNQSLVQIPLGQYDNPEIAYPQNKQNPHSQQNEIEKIVEKYVDNTQHKTAGEFSDFEILLILIIIGVFIVYKH